MNKKLLISLLSTALTTGLVSAQTTAEAAIITASQPRNIQSITTATTARSVSTTLGSTSQKEVGRHGSTQHQGLQSSKTGSHGSGTLKPAGRAVGTQQAGLASQDIGASRNPAGGSKMRSPQSSILLSQPASKALGATATTAAQEAAAKQEVNDIRSVNPTYENGGAPSQQTYPNSH